MTRCYTSQGKRAHYTEDGRYTLCKHRAVEYSVRDQEPKMRMAPMCYRCEKAEEAITQ